MPASYSWTLAEHDDLIARVESLEQSRDFLALRGAFAYVSNDGSGSPVQADGGIVALTAGQPHAYTLAAPASEIARLELFNPMAVPHTVSVSGGRGFSSLTFPPGSAIVLAATSDGISTHWHVQPSGVTVS